MAHIYKDDDMFYDVESLSNVFTLAWWLPSKNMNAIILSYLDDDNIIKSETDIEYIKDVIYKLHPKLKTNNTKLIFENIANTGRINEFCQGNKQNPKLGLQSFAKRLGLANRYTHLNAPIDKRNMEDSGLQYHEAYYPVKDTDPDYDENKHGYRFGYNSTNYDTTELAFFLGNMHDKYFTEEYCNKPAFWNSSTPISAKILRDFNDELFESTWKSKMPQRLAYQENLPPGSFGNFSSPDWILRKAWLLTGRYIDVARLNEKQQKVGLKRLLGMLGLQIMESDKLSTNSSLKTLEEFAELLAYNIADVINLQTLFEHRVYLNGFNIRGKLLQMYPQAIYDQKKGFAKQGGQELQADAGNYMNIRRDRLARDSTSAKFVEYALAPYKPIKDIKTVSYLYPSKTEAEKLGVPQTDILEDTKKFFENTVTDDVEDQAHKDFMNIYNFYNAIRGKNFNSSKQYVWDYGNQGNLPDELYPKNNDYIKDLMAEFNTNLFYHYKDEFNKVAKSSCLVNFSIGGIHGGEVDMYKYLQDEKAYNIELKMQNEIESRYESALEAINGDIYIKLPENLLIPDRLKEKTKKDGTIKIREFIKGGSTRKKATWRDVKGIQLFKNNPDNGKYELNKKYKYVSIGPSHHEDFTSYYPLLISRLSIFINPSYHGYEKDGITPKDPYMEMFLERVAKKKESKDKTLSDLVRQLADIEQESRKLLINAASGAGDATFDNNILANNAIISMRIIGQLFAWRIGQAQTMAGARVPSTNTDGLYTMDITAELNDEILEEIAKDMYIEIEPERLDRFVSKDSNNRLEYYQGKITSAKGGTLNSWDGPEPTQSLDHSAIIDRILAQYLSCQEIENPANVPFDRDKAENLFNDFIRKHIKAGKPQRALIFFQWILASSTGTHRYNYARDINKHTGEVTIRNLQQYNRIFLIKENNSKVTSEIHLATRRAISKKDWNKVNKKYYDGDIKANDRWNHDDESIEILKMNGLDILDENTKQSSKHYTDEASKQKVRGMPINHNIAIYNNSIVDLDDDKALAMINELDIDQYLEILESTFKTWSNI